jgi:hypothetical protein
MNYVRVRSAIHHADKMHLLTGKRFYVIKIHNRLRVYDRNKVNYLIDCGILRKELRGAMELQRISLYYTR